MSRYQFTNVKEARKYFNAEIKPLVVAKYGSRDTCALDEEWNRWTDVLRNDRLISKHAYDTWTRTR